MTNLVDCNGLCNGNKLEAVMCRGNKTLARKKLNPNLLQAIQSKQTQKINRRQVIHETIFPPLLPNKHHFRMLLTEPQSCHRVALHWPWWSFTRGNLKQRKYYARFTSLQPRVGVGRLIKPEETPHKFPCFPLGLKGKKVALICLFRFAFKSKWRAAH